MNGNIIEADLENVYKRDIPWEKLDGKTVLITGAYGMLASYVTFMLIYLNEVKGMNINIIAAVRSESKFRARFKEAADFPYIDLYTRDINQKLDIKGRVDYIIHAASPASPDYYTKSPIEVLTPNVIANYNLLRLAEEKNISGYLLFSTGDIYGAVKDREKISETDYGVMDPLDLHSCYGESKRMAETMCKCWHHQKGVPTKIARIWHTYAPTMDIKNDPRVFASFTDDIVNGRDIVMKSSGEAKRSFCYIADAIAGYFLILLRGECAQAYNVCNSLEFYSISQLANLLTDLYPEKGLRVILKEREKGDGYLENTSANYIPPDDTKLRCLGWNPQYSAQRGFKRVIDYLI